MAEKSSIFDQNSIRDSQATHFTFSSSQPSMKAYSDAIMRPSPSKLRHHHMSTPIKSAHTHCRPRKQQALHALPFSPQPSRLVVHKYPDMPNEPCPPQKPATSLMLSLNLAQKIHQLLLASRQIETLTRGSFAGHYTEASVSRKLERVEDKYDGLLEEVEFELETVWINAGLLPASMPLFPLVNRMHIAVSAQPTPFHEPSISTKDGKDWTKDTYTVDKDLKRKREEEDEKKDNKQGRKKQQKKLAEVDVGWVQPDSVQPIGVQQAVMPLNWIDQKRLRGWSVAASWGRQRVQEEAVSPKGTVYAV